jgi:hypothetical protein
MATLASALFGAKVSTAAGGAAAMLAGGTTGFASGGGLLASGINDLKYEKDATEGY